TRARQPRRPGSPNQTKGHRTEGCGKDELGDPGWNTRADDGACFALAADEVHGTPGQEGRDRGAHHGRHDVSEASAGSATHQRGTGQRQQLPVPCGYRCSEESDPQDQMLRNRSRPGNTKTDSPAKNDLSHRQDRQTEQRQSSEAVLDPYGEASEPRSVGSDAGCLAGSRLLLMN